jgi:hypothetical protein
MNVFITNWILKYGKGPTRDTKLGRMTNFLNETRNFLKIAREYMGRRAQVFPDNSSEPSENHPAETIADFDSKLFEIHRIRNRMDTGLVRVPGGYRDVAFKFKIGFVRYATRASSSKSDLCLNFSFHFDDAEFHIFFCIDMGCIDLPSPVRFAYYLSGSGHRRLFVPNLSS